MRIRTVVADDEPLLRAGVRTIVESAGDIEVVAEAADGRAAVEAVLAYRPDVVLLDITMPVLDGLAVLAELRRRTLDARVVLLTAFGTEPNVVGALRHEASGFVLKHCAPDELIRAVRAAHAGEAYLSPAVTRTVLGLVKPSDQERRATAVARTNRLGPRERDVLRLIGEGLSNAEIAARLRMSEMTIKTYVSRILTKTGCANRVQAALTAHHAGL
ncbi:response regulator transcription factor [Micromonospora sp. NPDC049559]|uniref:response regulator transcription factor n=1 Tax=Micromonospora sp. NPDC049559 TaxID=3155923 RepID=UPI00343073EF